MFKRVTLTKEELMQCRDEAAAAVHEHRQDYADPDISVLYEKDQTFIEKIRDEIRKEQEKLDEGVKWWVICEMALGYLDLVEKEKENK